MSGWSCNFAGRDGSDNGTKSLTFYAVYVSAAVTGKLESLKILHLRVKSQDGFSHITMLEQKAFVTTTLKT